MPRKATPTPRLTFPANDFARAYRAVAMAASKDRSLPVLCGVLIELFPDGVRFVATDSYHLLYTSLGDVSGIDAVPAESYIVDDEHGRLDSLLKHATKASLFGGSDLALQPGLSMLFCLDGEQVPATITQGPYPDWKKLVRENTTRTHCGQVSIAAWLLANVEKAVKVFGLQPSEESPLKLSTGSDPLKPCAFVAGHRGVELAGMFMPVRLAS